MTSGERMKFVAILNFENVDLFFLSTLLALCEWTIYKGDTTLDDLIEPVKII